MSSVLSLVGSGAMVEALGAATASLSLPVSGLVPMHATPLDQPPPLTPVRLLTAWTFDIWAALGLAVPTLLYLFGVWRLHRRGVRWPIGRTLAFCFGGMGSAAIATMSVLGTYDTVLLSIHMVQHMLLTMIVPMFMALGAPVTLALRVLPKRGRSVLSAIVHSKVVKVLSFPPLAFGLYIANPFILYFSPLYEVTLQSPFWHNWLHVHFVVTSSLFYWPLVGVDPIPNRMSYPLRVLMFFLTLPFHAFLGVTIMGAPLLIAEEWYLSFGRAWPPSPLADQEIAGGILWGSGDTIASVVMAVLFVQWFRSSKLEARREDRRLDRLEAAERRREQAAGAALDGSALDGSALDGSALDGSALDGSALDGSALDGSALDGSALDGSADERAGGSTDERAGGSAGGSTDDADDGQPSHHEPDGPPVADDDTMQPERSATTAAPSDAS